MSFADIQLTDEGRRIAKERFEQVCGTAVARGSYEDPNFWRGTVEATLRVMVELELQARTVDVAPAVPRRRFLRRLEGKS